MIHWSVQIAPGVDENLVICDIFYRFAYRQFQFSENFHRPCKHNNESNQFKLLNSLIVITQCMG